MPLMCFLTLMPLMIRWSSRNRDSVFAAKQAAGAGHPKRDGKCECDPNDPK